MKDIIREYGQTFVFGGLVIGVVFGLDYIFRPYLTSQIQIGRVNFLTNTILTMILIFVYYEIKESEEAQSESIREQVAVMQDQLKAAHEPQISIDGIEFGPEGLSLYLSNFGNGLASNFHISLDISPSDKSDYQIDLEFIEAQTQDVTRNIEPDTSKKQFEIHTICTLYDGDGEAIEQGPLLDISDEMSNQRIDYIDMTFRLEYDSILEQGKSMDFEYMVPTVAAKS